ncbi:D-lactaldehyde dehydrogenase [Ceratobasidium sp. AG-I]|nr:D-lactaldehyde dehydrogenase [Ceratobasidium sp. AG-I]
MSAVQAPAKILFTGANGYFAAYAVKDLLSRGYTVVGTVRSSSKGDELKKLHAQYGDKFSYAVVPDIVKEGAFDEVIKEGKFDGVAHAASPVVITGATPDDFFIPAIHGTVGVLGSIKKYGPTVKRVVLTSSIASAAQYQPGVVHTEAHWNDAIVKLVEAQGTKSAEMQLYAASKTHAEKSAWKFMEDNKPGFDLVAILPALILGAPIHNPTSRDQLTSTNAVLSSIYAPRPDSELNQYAHRVVHISDVAALHSVSFSAQEASGHRLYAVGGAPTWQEIYDALNEAPAFPGVPKGSPGNKPSEDGLKFWDTSFSKKLLGKEFIDAKDSFRETEKYYQEKRWSFN